MLGFRHGSSAMTACANEKVFSDYRSHWRWPIMTLVCL